MGALPDNPARGDVHANGNAETARLVAALAAGIVAGEKLAIARALNLVEDRRMASRGQVAALVQAIRSKTAAPRGAETRVAHRVGITGPPGVGKSTLTAALSRELRRRGKSVGVLAVDPSSVRSGGSLLGDRARMAFDPGDEKLFVRSFATAGEAGGLSYAIPAAVEILSAAFDVVLLETVGVGQTETDVEHVADTVALVVQPGSGDTLQFIKAGIMEIPDLLVVNKADHESLAQRAVADLRGALRATVAAGADGLSDLTILATSARDHKHIDELADQLDAHFKVLREVAQTSASSLLSRRRRGQVAWTYALLHREHGDYGVRALGGRRALTSRIEAAFAASDVGSESAATSAIELASTLGQAVLDHICQSQSAKEEDRHE